MWPFDLKSVNLRLSPDGEVRISLSTTVVEPWVNKEDGFQLLPTYSWSNACVAVARMMLCHVLSKSVLVFMYYDVVCTLMMRASMEVAWHCIAQPCLRHPDVHLSTMKSGLLPRGWAVSLHFSIERPHKTVRGRINTWHDSPDFIGENCSCIQYNHVGQQPCQLNTNAGRFSTLSLVCFHKFLNLNFVHVT